MLRFAEVRVVNGLTFVDLKVGDDPPVSHSDSCWCIELAFEEMDRAGSEYAAMVIRSLRAILRLRPGHERCSRMCVTSRDRRIIRRVQPL